MMKIKLMTVGFLCSIGLFACSISPEQEMQFSQIGLGCDERYTSCGESAEPALLVTQTETNPAVEQKNEVTEPSSPPILSKPSSSTPPVFIPVLFGFDQAETHLLDIDQQVAYLIQHPEVSITLHGYTDPIGTKAYNLGLSQRRADFMKKQFVKQGIAPNRIQTQAHGETHLIKVVDEQSRTLNWNDLVVYLAPNRRVELTYDNK